MKDATPKPTKAKLEVSKASVRQIEELERLLRSPSELGKGSVPVKEAVLERYAWAIRCGHSTAGILPAGLLECALADWQVGLVRSAYRDYKRLHREKARPRSKAKKPAAKQESQHRPWVTFWQGGAPGLGRKA